jgi:hypothetical protein
MKAVIRNSSPCRLTKGELRRVPPVRSGPPVGYHVCCPRCGYVTLALNHPSELGIEESADGAVTFSTSLRCLFCCVLIGLCQGELALEEDEHVRHIQYR